MYRAGGSPKVAEKELERKLSMSCIPPASASADNCLDDAARLSSKVRGELPGKGKELKTEAKVYGEKAGVKVDETVSALP